MQQPVPDPVEPLLARRAGEVLARAFHDDPLFLQVKPDAGRRARMLDWLFGAVVRYSLLYGQVETTGSAECAACWLPPGRTRLNLGRMVRSGLHAAPLRMGLAACLRFNAYSARAERLHHHHAPGPHWYLFALGVMPAAQGQGMGTALLEPMLARLSREGAACYLETSKERNIRLYERHGFAVVGHDTVPGLGVPIWAMLREAAG